MALLVSGWATIAIASDFAPDDSFGLPLFLMIVSNSTASAEVQGFPDGVDICLRPNS
jgi:hypothetical protein